LLPVTRPSLLGKTRITSSEAMVGASSSADADGSAGADTAEPRYSFKAPALPYRGGPVRVVARLTGAGEAARQGHVLPSTGVSAY